MPDETDAKKPPQDSPAAGGRRPSFCSAAFVDMIEEEWISAMCSTMSALRSGETARHKQWLKWSMALYDLRTLAADKDAPRKPLNDQAQR